MGAAAPKAEDQALKKNSGKKQSETFVLQFGSHARANFQLALGERPDRHPMVAYRVPRHSNGNALEPLLILRGDAERVTTLRLGLVERQVCAVDQACP
jgi:hypothetical protein